MDKHVNKHKSTNGKTFKVTLPQWGKKRSYDGNGKTDYFQRGLERLKCKVCHLN